MNKKLKKFLIGLCAFIIFIAFFGKTIFMHIMGFLFFGFPEVRVTAINEYSEPMMVGDTWIQDDLFEVTVERSLVTSEPDENRKLVYVDVLVENDAHYSRNNNELECYLRVRGGVGIGEKYKNNPFFLVKIGETEQYRYKFYIPLEVEEITLSTEIPTLDREHYYRKDWTIDVRDNAEKRLDLPKIGSAVARYTEQLESINDTLLNPTKAGDSKVVCYVNDVPILQDELSFRTALDFTGKYPRSEAKRMDVLIEEKVLQSIAIKHGILPTEEQIAQYIQREQQEEALVGIVEDICASGDLSVDEYWSLYERYNVIRILTAQNVYQYYSAEQSMIEEEYNLQMVEWVEQAEIEDC